MIILGIDPGLATLGYGVFEKDERGNFRALDCGVVTTPKEEGLPVRLAMLEEGLKKILDKFHHFLVCGLPVLTGSARQELRSAKKFCILCAPGILMG